MIRFDKKTLFSLAFALLLVTNALIYLGIYLNRQSPPTALVDLSQRELTNYDEYNREDSAKYFSLIWRGDAEGGYHQISQWLDTKKLKSLGFSLRFDDEGNLENTPSKEVFVVLEMDGKSYQNALQNAQKKVDETKAKQADSSFFNYDNDLKQAQEEYESERDKSSRLFAIDASNDAQTLKKLYPNSKTHIILKGVIEPYGTLKEGAKGRITQLHTTQIFIPHQFHTTLQNPNQKHKYTVTLAIGSRYEPYILEVR